MLQGKIGIVMGIANNRSIASHIAKSLAESGARMIFTHLPDAPGKDRNEKRLKTITDEMEPLLIYPCDVSSDEDLDKFFSEVESKVGEIDFIVHSIAFAPTDDIKKNTIESSREGFNTAMDISVYSLLAIANRAQKLMKDGGNIITMSYYGGEKVMPGYNLMGLCKSALETAVRYAAFELGSKGISINAISAGPMKTLAASAVGDFKNMLGLYGNNSPMKRNIDGEDVGALAKFLLSKESRMITGEVVHLDGGFHTLGCTQEISEDK